MISSGMSRSSPGGVSTRSTMSWVAKRLPCFDQSYQVTSNIRRRRSTGRTSKPRLACWGPKRLVAALMSEKLKGMSKGETLTSANAMIVFRSWT